MLLAGLRRRHSFADVARELAEQWREFRALGEPPGRVGAVAYGAMCGADSTSFEYMCAVEVDSFERLPEGTGRMRVPPQRYAVFAHRGHVLELGETWARVFEWLDAGDHESAHLPDFERYGPEYAPEPGTGGREVWVGVLPRRAG